MSRKEDITKEDLWQKTGTVCNLMSLLTKDIDTGFRSFDARVSHLINMIRLSVAHRNAMNSIATMLIISSLVAVSSEQIEIV